jgi:SAM-dependent methyltransferase
MPVFARYAPLRRPLTVVDLGAGRGRLGPALADTFGGLVYGVEPSVRRLRMARAWAPHPCCVYLEGRCESVPLADESADLVLMFMSLHHVTDRRRAFAEVARVAGDGAVVLVADRIADVAWHRFFPTAHANAIRDMPTVAEVMDTAEFDLTAVDNVDAGLPYTTTELYRLVHAATRGAVGTESTREEVARGLAALAAEAAAEPNRIVPPPVAELLVLRRRDRRRSATALDLMSQDPR